jgi:hypothetical protein
LDKPIDTYQYGSKSLVKAGRKKPAFAQQSEAVLVVDVLDNQCQLLFIGQYVNRPKINQKNKCGNEMQQIIPLCTPLLGIIGQIQKREWQKKQCQKTPGPKQKRPMNQEFGDDRKTHPNSHSQENLAKRQGQIGRIASEAVEKYNDA